MTPNQVELVLHMGRWSEDAACKAHPAFLNTMLDLTRQDIRDQKEVCADCPVRLQCLGHAMRYPEQGGVWGGMGPKERTSFYRELKRENKDVYALWR